MEQKSKDVVVSGIRATGKMHLGNYHGAVKNWVALQEKYNCYFFVADLHALTTHYQQDLDLLAVAKTMIIDWLALGLDPTKCTIFIQSQVPMHAQLQLLLGMITPISWLERVPTYKDQQQRLNNLDLATYGFLGYPLLQSADVLLYQAKYVPVGEDQVSHIELTREIARRFNHIYNKQQQPLLIEPQPLLTNVTKLTGVDGQKMSKSYNNVIEVGENAESIWHKIKTMPTDPARVKRTDCGDPAKCPVWQLHKVYSSMQVKTWVDQGCRTAGIGCLDCKAKVTEAIEAEQASIRDNINNYKQDLNMIDQIINEGRTQAIAVASKTLTAIEQAMGI